MADSLSRRRGGTRFLFAAVHGSRWHDSNLPDVDAVVMGPCDDKPYSTVAYSQTDADFSRFIIGEINAGLFKGFLYLEYGREVSFHNAFVPLDPLKRRQTDPGRASKLTLAPAKQCPRCPYLRGISHPFVVFAIRSRLTISPL